jgi:cyclohexa-1,5-dienecarbonyl-CoA hydratase
VSSVSVSFDPRQTRAAFTIFHPKGNIITREMVASLRSALEMAAENPHLKLITIEGAGADFSFGASIPEHAPGQIDDVLPEMHALVYELLEAPAPTAALVRGRCFGGGFELALACDLIFAEEDARFALPEIQLGLFPPAASALLPVKAGQAPAARTILTGATVGVRDPAVAPLLALVATPGELGAQVESWFQQHLAPRSAAALRHAASAARAGLVAHVRTVLPGLERLYLEDLMRTQDAVEGIDAFLAKRKPAWTDR